MNSICFDLKGKIAVVTGGSRGIGAATSIRLAEAGADIAIVHRGGANPLGLEKMIRQLGVKVMSLNSTDVNNAAGVKKAVKAIIAEFEHIDILVNNAGIYKHSMPEETSEREWDEVIGTNLRGAFLMSREVGRAMIQFGRGGKIVNVASINAFLPESDFVHYDASKAGLIGMTRSLALSWGKHGITVNAVAPGLVDTGSLWSTARDRAVAFEKSAPMHQVLEPDDVANVILFLCSAFASRITGQTIVVDSGVSLAGYMTRVWS